MNVVARFRVDVNAGNYYNATPLGRAVAGGNVRVVRLLLERNTHNTSCILMVGGRAAATVVPEIAAMLS